MKFKYSIGDKIVHSSKKKEAIVTKVFSTEVGPRYYIKHSGWTWSVPETTISPSIKSSTYKSENSENALQSISSLVNVG